jgi:hypothetical protein
MILTLPKKMKAGLIMVSRLVKKVLVQNNGILRKAESRYLKEPWTVASVHMNRTISVHAEAKMKA